MRTMQIKSWKYMLQTSENYNNIQEPTNKQSLEDISQYKLQNMPFISWSVQYETYSMLVETRFYTTLD